MKIANIEKENLHVLWTTWEISIKLLENMWLIIILKVTKKQRFTLSLENTFFEKPEGASIDPPSRSAFLGLRTPGKYPGKYLNQSPGSVQTFECIIPSAVCVRIRRS